jgi:dienelactone hydrolase
MNRLVFLLMGILSVFQAGAAIVEKTVNYEQGGAELEGYHAYDNELEGKQPSVLIIHQWTGLADYEKLRARMLAEMGFNVFAADVYGKGVPPQPPESGEVAGKYKQDRELYRARMLAGLEVLKSDERTAPGKIVALGYCIGGTGVLELARAGVPLQGVVACMDSGYLDERSF